MVYIDSPHSCVSYDRFMGVAARVAGMEHGILPYNMIGERNMPMFYQV
jgi:hypothetical protein